MTQNSGQIPDPIPPLLPLLPHPVDRDELRVHLEDGARCVRYETCVSVGVATLRRESPVYLTHSWQERYIRGVRYFLISLLCGPWGIPWGPILTARAAWTNLTGGADVTDEIARDLGLARGPA